MWKKFFQLISSLIDISEGMRKEVSHISLLPVYWLHFYNYIGVMAQQEIKPVTSNTLRQFCTTMLLRQWHIWSMLTLQFIKTYDTDVSCSIRHSLLKHLVRFSWLSIAPMWSKLQSENFLLLAFWPFWAILCMM